MLAVVVGHLGDPKVAFSWRTSCDTGFLVDRHHLPSAPGGPRPAWTLSVLGGQHPGPLGSSWPFVGVPAPEGFRSRACGRAWPSPSAGERAWQPSRSLGTREACVTQALGARASGCDISSTLAVASARHPRAPAPAGPPASAPLCPCAWLSAWPAALPPSGCFAQNRETRLRPVSAVGRAGARPACSPAAGACGSCQRGAMAGEAAASVCRPSWRTRSFSGVGIRGWSSQAAVWEAVSAACRDPRPWPRGSRPVSVGRCPPCPTCLSPARAARRGSRLSGARLRCGPLLPLLAWSGRGPSPAPWSLSVLDATLVRLASQTCTSRSPKNFVEVLFTMILGFSNSVLCEITEDFDELTQATGFCAVLPS